MKKLYESNMKTISRILAVLLGTGLLMVFAGINIAQNKEDRIIEQTANLSYFTGFSLPTVDGGTFTQEDLKAAKVTVFNGWGPWCPNCVDEMPDLEELDQIYREKGLQVVGVVADYYYQINELKNDYDPEIADTLDSLGITYQNILADEVFNEQVFPTMGGFFPCTWVVDSEGKVIDRISGGLSRNEWAAQFDSYLEEEQ